MSYLRGLTIEPPGIDMSSSNALSNEFIAIQRRRLEALQTDLSRHPIPKDRLEASPEAVLTVEEAAARE